MPAARRDWTCPRCGISWSIPRNAPDPEKCPKCPKAEFVPAFQRKPQASKVVYWVGSILLWGVFAVINVIIVGWAYDMWVPILVNGSDASELLILLLARSAVTTSATIAYFMPVQVVVYRNHPYSTPISLLTIFGGWTCVGWIAAIVWASMPVKP